MKVTTVTVRGGLNVKIPSIKFGDIQIPLSVELTAQLDEGENPADAVRKLYKAACGLSLEQYHEYKKILDTLKPSDVMLNCTDKPNLGYY